MFGGKYSRSKFWAASLSIFAIVWLSSAFANFFGGEGLRALLLLVGVIVLANILANRIRDYGSNPWLALLSLIPFVGLIQALYFGIKNKKSGV